MLQHCFVVQRILRPNCLQAKNSPQLCTTSTMFNFKMIWEKMFQRNHVPSPEDRAVESMNQLNIKASMFIILFHQHHQSMLQSVQNCQMMSERIKQHQHTRKACLGFSALLGVLTIILPFAILLHPIHGKSLQVYLDIYSGISEAMQEHEEIHEHPTPIGLVILLIIVAPTVVGFAFTFIDEIRIVRTVNLSIQNFRSKLSLLNPELKGVKRVCEDLRSSSWSVLAGTERVNIMTLEKSVLELFILTESLTLSASTHSIYTQVYMEYSRMLSQLDKMQVLLDVYNGNAILIESDFVD